MVNTYFKYNYIYLMSDFEFDHRRKESTHLLPFDLGPGNKQSLVNV